MIPGVEWWQAPTSGIWHVVGCDGYPRKEISDGDVLLCGWVRRSNFAPKVDRVRDGAQLGRCCATCAAMLRRRAREGSTGNAPQPRDRDRKRA